MTPVGRWPPNERSIGTKGDCCWIVLNHDEAVVVVPPSQQRRRGSTWAGTASSDWSRIEGGAGEGLLGGRLGNAERGRTSPRRAAHAASVRSTRPFCAGSQQHRPALLRPTFNGASATTPASVRSGFELLPPGANVTSIVVVKLVRRWPPPKSKASWLSAMPGCDRAARSEVQISAGVAMSAATVWCPESALRAQPG